MEEDYIYRRLRNLRKVLGEKEREVEGFLISNPINCRYLSGFTGSSVYLLITMEEAFLLTDFRYREQALEEAPCYSLISFQGSLASTLESFLKKKALKKIAFEHNHLTVYWYEVLRIKLPDLELVPLHQVVEGLRTVKDVKEINLIKEAARITEKSYKRILPFLKPGVGEEDVAIELDYIIKKEGGRKASFDFIVASGKRSSLPHGVASGKKLEHGDMVVIDFGIYYNGYCSDMTRTVAMSHAGNSERKKYRVVLEAQKKALEGIREGLSGEEADELARQVIIKEGWGDNFGHGLGHGVGLEVHEEPRLAPGNKNILKSGMITTVEPGIYFPGWGGIRIEDMVLISENSCELLTGDLKEELIVI